MMNLFYTNDCNISKFLIGNEMEVI